MKTLFIGNITLDKINEEFRIGGPGYYGGRALASYLGVDVYVLTHVSNYYREFIVNTLGNYGVKILEIKSNAIPIFVIDSGKTIQFQGFSDKISSNIIEHHLKNNRYDIVFIVPIMNEIDVDSIHILKEYKKRINSILSLDIQGFVRRVAEYGIKCEWTKELEIVLTHVDIVHGNITEFCFTQNEILIIDRIKELSTTSHTAFLVSLDAKGTYLIYLGDIIHIPSLSVAVINDVGAGDILLSVTSYYKAKGNDIITAAIKGVTAASLKVENSHRDWFSEKLIEVIAQEHKEKLRRL